MEAVLESMFSTNNPNDNVSSSMKDIISFYLNKGYSNHPLMELNVSDIISKFYYAPGKCGLDSSLIRVYGNEFVRLFGKCFHVCNCSSTGTHFPLETMGIEEMEYLYSRSKSFQKQMKGKRLNIAILLEREKHPQKSIYDFNTVKRFIKMSENICYPIKCTGNVSTTCNKVNTIIRINSYNFMLKSSCSREHSITEINEMIMDRNPKPVPSRISYKKLTSSEIKSEIDFNSSINRIYRTYNPITPDIFSLLLKEKARINKKRINKEKSIKGKSNKGKNNKGNDNKKRIVVYNRKY